jgi:hypothetical protein
MCCGNEAEVSDHDGFGHTYKQMKTHTYQYLFIKTSASV